MPTSNSSSSQPLPPKENALFKRILKCYEQKQYKNGLKFAKQILSNPKFAEHGETLAMKGLTLNCLGRKEEAYDYVRRGLRNDLKSHVCWHVFGLLQRSDKKYDEAIKCYRNALKWDKDNIQILRDLSLLQIQMRDLEGYKDTRYQLFQLRPTQRASWIGFAMSYHLLNDYHMALKILEEFRKTQQGVNREVVGQVMQALYSKKAAYDYEHSELLLYQNSVILESGDSLAALDHLDEYQDQICDKANLMETRGTLLIKNGKFSQAEECFAELIRRNPENHSYYRLMEEARGCHTHEKKLEMYKQYQDTYPKAQAPQRLPLNIATGADFINLLAPYIKKALRKGVPPLFVDLRPLYQDLEKTKMIEDLCLEYLENLKSHQSFDSESEKSSKEPETVTLWLYYYLSQHYDYKENFTEALRYVDIAIEHTPTLIELYLLKGKIYKHVGNLEEAVKWLDEAQSLDTADRYINCKCAKYMLRANRVKEAEDMCQKFTREGVPATENLNEMQCMWFQTETANAYQRLGQWGEALKKCTEVDRHFNEIIEDQFDFHTYCMRKMTLRAYVELLRLEDVIRSHRFYEKAAICAINVYLRLHDKPVTVDDKLKDLMTENMDPSELKKLRNKQKKAEKKAEKMTKQQREQQEKKDRHNKSQKKANNEEELDAPIKDELVPEKLERPENPLVEAMKFLVPLQSLASTHLMTHVLAFEIAFRKRRPLLMLQSVKRALKLDTNDNPKVHGCLIRFQMFVNENTKNLTGPVKAVLDRETKDIFKGLTPMQRNEKFIQKHKTSFYHMAIGVKMTALLEPSKAETSAEILTNLENFSSEFNLKICSDVLDDVLCGEYEACGKQLSRRLVQEFQKKFPLASKFQEATSVSNHNNFSSINVEP